MTNAPQVVESDPRDRPENSIQFKTLDDEARSCAQPMQQVPCLMPYSERRFVDRYLSGVLHLCVISPFGDKAKCGFTVCRDFMFDGNQSKAPAGDTEGCQFGFDGKKPSVFSLDIKVMQQPDVTVPSLVRLQQFKLLPFAGGKPFYELMPLVVSANETRDVVSDGEISLVKPSLCRGAERGRRPRYPKRCGWY